MHKQLMHRKQVLIVGCKSNNEDQSVDGPRGGGAGTYIHTYIHTYRRTYRIDRPTERGILCTRGAAAAAGGARGMFYQSAGTLYCLSNAPFPVSSGLLFQTER
jgi:hypothetical protein